MAAAISAGIFALIALVMLVVGIFSESSYEVQNRDGYGYKRDGTRVVRNNFKLPLIFGAIVPIIIGGAIFVGSGFNTVPTKSVGVVTSFGKVQNEYGPGAHWMVPWKSLNIIQDTIQTDDFEQANGSGTYNVGTSGINGYCITVRLGGQQEGCADVTLQTRVVANAIPQLYADYSSYGSDLQSDIQTYVVKRELTTALNRTLGDYNPVEDVTASLTNGASQFSSFDQQLLKAMNQDIGSEVQILNFNLQYVHYDSQTQNRINEIATQYAATQVALQQEQTNKAISAANQALANNNTLTPQVLANECYTTTEDAIKAGYALPADWSCSGQNSNLLIEGK
jgi:regulator of protease activity HflC (stomatin/prohibitin superfamily)